MNFATKIKMTKDYSHHAFREYPFYTGEVYSALAPIETDGVFAERKEKNAEPFKATHLIPIPATYFVVVDKDTPLAQHQDNAENIKNIKAQKSVPYIFLGVIFIGLLSMDLIRRLK